MAFALLLAAPFIIGTGASFGTQLTWSIMRDNWGEERFNQHMDNNVLNNNPFVDTVRGTCANNTGNTVLTFFGYDCDMYDRFDHNVAEREAAEAAAAAAAAQAEADAAFAANFDAAWSAHMAELNKPPPILRDAQGTPLEPEGPARVQGFPQRIPKNPGVQTKALPEDEPRRVYNQDDSSEEPQLAIGAQKEPGLPLMTIGIVATGGVLIFLWSTRKR